MSPIRRYLRVTKNTVLEVRIYSDQPSDGPWLASSAVLKRVLAAVRPRVLPKLREENSRSRSSNTKGSGSLRAAAAAAGKDGRSRRGKKGGGAVKDVVVGADGDFEAAIFLTDASTRHALMVRKKEFRDEMEGKRTARLGRDRRGKGLAGWLNKGQDEGDAIDVEGEVAIREEEEDDDQGARAFRLRDVPEARFDETTGNDRSRGGKRRLGMIEVDDNDDDDDDDDGQDEELDEKKLALMNTYKGFAIYGRILCLVVKRFEKRAGSRPEPVYTGGSQMLERWVGTQAAQEAGLVEDDDG